MDSPAHDVVIAVHNLGKCYRIYDRPQNRLKQALLRGRRQYFREFWALHNVSLEIRRGETVGIIGRNGCGKSTLLQLICSTLHPTTGEVSIRGRVAALLELGAGFNPEFTGRDNVFTNAAILGLKQAEIAARFDQIVAFSELGNFINRPVKTYSSGMYVRLAFAVAISVDPDILVVDEALSVGDEAFQRKCFARIEDIQRRGGTILFVSHSAGTVIELCNRAVLLDQGDQLLTGEPKAVVARYRKLLYAPPEKAAAIRAEIQREGLSGPVETVAQEPSPAPAAPEVVVEHSRAYYEPDLQPKSTVCYGNQAAQILDHRITTPCGRQVNILVSGEEYVVRYRVAFAAEAFQVRFGTLLKNVRGIEISGMASPRHSEPALECVPAGVTAELQFRFRCLLLPGAYFANVGVMGMANGRLEFLHRMEDGLMFRVQEGEVSSTVGLADLFVQSQVDLPLAEMQEAA
jgi:lipopolysaccharide transport system ATP-binding protein